MQWSWPCEALSTHPCFYRAEREWNWARVLSSVPSPSSPSSSVAPEGDGKAPSLLPALSFGPRAEGWVSLFLCSTN